MGSEPTIVESALGFLDELNIDRSITILGHSSVEEQGTGLARPELCRQVINEGGDILIESCKAII